jgi:serine/threonine protein kinase
VNDNLHLKPGLIIGRYELISFLGQGAMAIVYKAIYPVIDRTLAIKILREERCIDVEHRARFLREARSAGNLSHPNIVTVHDIGEFNNRPFIVMELLDGTPLDKLLESHKRFTIEEGAAIGMQLANALD